MIPQLILLAVTIIIAKIHSRLIKNGWVINHGLWVLIYLAITAIASYFSTWFMLGLGFLIRALFFDLALNFFRQLPLDYQNPSSNFWDKLVSKIPFWEQKLILLIILTTAEIWIF